jgi:hypothetical protein
VAASAYAWWLRALAPFATAGYRTGVLDRHSVTLTDGLREIRIPRGSWTRASLNDAEPDDRDELGAEDKADAHRAVRAVVMEQIGGAYLARRPSHPVREGQQRSATTASANR